MSIKFLNDIGKNIPLGGAKLIFLKLIPFHSNGFCTYCDHTTPNSFQTSITTTQTFQKRYITFLYLKGVKNYKLSKFKACFASRILFRVSVRLVIFEPLKYRGLEIGL